jgi:hypothetical protein
MEYWEKAQGEPSKKTLIYPIKNSSTASSSPFKVDACYPRSVAGSARRGGFLLYAFRAPPVFAA